MPPKARPPSDARAGESDSPRTHSPRLWEKVPLRSLANIDVRLESPSTSETTTPRPFPARRDPGGRVSSSNVRRVCFGRAFRNLPLEGRVTVIASDRGAAPQKGVFSTISRVPHDKRYRKTSRRSPRRARSLPYGPATPPDGHVGKSRRRCYGRAVPAKSAREIDETAGS